MVALDDQARPVALADTTTARTTLTMAPMLLSSGHELIGKADFTVAEVAFEGVHR